MIVPVRNEAETIGAALNALASQAGVERDRFEILVLANNCDDDSAELATSFARSHREPRTEVLEQSFPEVEANVGRARRWLMDEAARRLPPGGIIASTDGDTVVQANWLAATIREFDLGADLVGGRILASVDHRTRLIPAVRWMQLLDTMHHFVVAEAEDLLDPDPADPWPRHFQHFGASLAVGRDVYLAAGGLPCVPFLEDVALYDRLRGMDAAIRHSPEVRVATSLRLGGRVGMGLSTQLREWQAFVEAGEIPLMESAGFVIERIRERRRLREVWTSERVGETGLTFGRFFEREIAAFDPAIERLEPLNDAVAHLREAVAALRRAGRAALVSAPFKEIEPVRFRAAAGQVAERSI